jgi:hypothetical protein
MQIDEQAGIIRGVSVISQGIAKGHNVKEQPENENELAVPLEIDEQTLSQVKECADRKTKGVKVKADHGSGILATIGYLRDFVLEKGKVVADLYLLQSSGVKERLIEMAQTIPDEFGLSIAFEGQNEMADGVAKARCTNLLSADIVDMPAANPGGLFSAKCNSRMFLFSVPEVDTKEKLIMQDSPADKAPEVKPEEKPVISVEERMSALESKLADYEKRMGDMADKGEEGKDPMKEEAVAEPVKSEMAAEEAPKVEVEIETEKKDEEVKDEEKELSAVIDRAVITALSKLGVKPVQLSVDASKEQAKAVSLSIKDEFSQKATELGSKAKAWQWFAANKPESVKELSQVL